MKQFIRHSLGIFLMVPVLLSGCDRSVDENVQTVAVSTPDVADDPPAQGACAGWRKSLASGRHVDDVELCLRRMALESRAEAVEQARQMVDWEIEESGFSELKPLISALTGYPDAGSLERYLRAKALLPNKPGKYAQLDDALTASDYLRELGNVHWFDAETGMFPNRHDQLLAEVAGLSDLKEIDFAEEPPSAYEDEDDPYLLKANVGGKWYEQKATNYGDWYDIHAVLLLLNKIAVDQGSQTRFVTLPTEDQTAIIWVVGEQVLGSLLDEGLVHISAQELSMQTGKAFEAEVRGSVEAK